MSSGQVCRSIPFGKDTSLADCTGRSETGGPWGACSVVEIILTPQNCSVLQECVNLLGVGSLGNSASLAQVIPAGGGQVLAASLAAVEGQCSPLLCVLLSD